MGSSEKMGSGEKGKKARSLLDEAAHPLYYFDDDPDGLSAFLIMYRYKQTGKGVCVKAKPRLGKEFLRVADEYNPDLIISLDLVDIQTEFLDGIHAPLVMIDHHPLLKETKQKRMTYLNPLQENQSDVCTALATFKIFEDARPQDIWIAGVGFVGDWTFPQEYVDKLRKAYPALLPADIMTPEDALFSSPVGLLARVFTFILKGQTKHVNAAIKTLTRIDDPQEILTQSTPAGKFIYQQYEKSLQEYTDLLAFAESKATDEPLLLVNYEAKTSFTSELSNELLYKFPEKLVVIARLSQGEMKCSLRYAKGDLRPIVEKAIAGLHGYGGGHEHACGAVVREDQFEEFLSRLRDAVD